MEAIMKFILPDNQDEFDDCQNAANYKSALIGIDMYLRNKSKHERETKVEEVRDEFFEILKDNNINNLY